MSFRLLAGMAVLAAISSTIVWAFFRSRTPDADHVTPNVLTRINTEYRDLQ